MSNEQAVVVLNRLLAAEFESVVPRLAQAGPYVSLSTTNDRAEIDAILRDIQTHKRELTELILKLRGSPAPRRYATDTGGMHYVKLSHLMYEVIAGLRELIALYESSAGTTNNSEADALISRILDRYRKHLSTLDRIHGAPVSKTA